MDTAGPSLTCPICQDVFSDPAMLPCGHIFCLSCIRTVWNADLSADGPFFCPECQILLPSDLTLEVEPSLLTLEPSLLTLEVEPSPLTLEVEPSPLTLEVEPSPLTLEPSPLTLEPSLLTLEVEPSPLTLEVEPSPLTLEHSPLTLEVEPSLLTLEVEPSLLTLEGEPSLQASMQDLSITGASLSQPASPPPSSPSSPVTCDHCIETASIAIRTCLTCDASLCRAHAALHQQRAVLRQHTLVEVTRDPLSLKCREHQEQLKLFCVEEQLPVCSLCLLVGRHQHHQALQVQDASAELKKMLETTMTQLLQRRMSAEQAMKDLDALYTETMKSTAAFRSRISDKYSRIRGLIEEDESLMVKMVDSEEVFISEWLEAQRQVLEEQIKETDSLRNTSKSLIQETNDLIFLQRITAHGLGRPLELPLLREVEKQMCSPEKLRTIERLVDDLTLALSQHVPRMWSYLRALTLDPSTAHPQLLVSQDMQQVHWGTQPSAETPGSGRLDAQYSILARESFSTGRHYWEVLVQDKPFWLIGTTTGEPGSPEGGPTKGLADQKKASWCVYHGDGQYLACHDAQETLLSVGSRVVKLGMMADLQQGVLSFYDADTLTLLHRFCVPCLEPLYPMFNPCINMNHLNRQPLTLFSLRDADRSRSVGGGAAGSSQSPS